MEKGDFSLKKKMSKKHHFPYEKIVIVGFSGAGKTTFSKALAPHLSKVDERLWTSVDLDDELYFHHKIASEKHLGEVIERLTLKTFRELERELLLKIMDTFEPPFILSLGGGAFSKEMGLELKKRKEVLTVFLNTPFETCFERIKNDSARPLTKLGHEGLRTLYLERLSSYEKAQVNLAYPELGFIDDFLANLSSKKH